MSANLAKYQAYYKLIYFLVNVVGLSPHYDDTKSLYRLTTYFGIFLSGAMGTKVLVHAFANLNNVMELVVALRCIVATYAATIRMVCCLINWKELVFLEKHLGAKFEKELKTEKNQPALLEKISLYSKFMHFLNISTAGAIWMYLAPFFFLNFKYNKSVPILPGKYPFPVEPKTPLYWTIFGIELVMYLYYVLFAITGVDNAFGMHCFRISGLLRLAKTRVNNLNPANPNCRDQLYECIVIHQLVIRSKEALQKAYGVVIMWNYVTCAMVMCTLLWQIDQVKSQISATTLFYVLVYLACKLIQCFIYSYYGACITLESENYQNAVYTSNWPGSGNVRLVKDLLLVLTQRTIALKACGFFLITMEFFEKICNTTISYFFLLQSMDAKN